jgi:DNA invertase Pin-like site-specific DNA recombinase
MPAACQNCVGIGWFSNYRTVIAATPPYPDRSHARRLRTNLDRGTGGRLAAQERDLKRAGCERLFSEQVSSVAERLQLAAALDYVREGDKLIVTRLDRLARGMGDLLEIAEQLRGKAVALQVLDPAMDTSTAAGELIFHVFGAAASSAS